MKQRDQHYRRENIKEDTRDANEGRDFFKTFLGVLADKLVLLTELPAKPELGKVT